jgi:hypothetical protein
MANQPMSMMKLKALIHYKEEGRTNRFIGKSLGLSRTTVVKYVQFLESSGLSWAALLVLDECKPPTNPIPPVPSGLLVREREAKRPTAPPHAAVGGRLALRHPSPFLFRVLVVRRVSSFGAGVPPVG